MLVSEAKSALNVFWRIGTNQRLFFSCVILGRFDRLRCTQFWMFCSNMLVEFVIGRECFPACLTINASSDFGSNWFFSDNVEVGCFILLRFFKGSIRLVVLSFERLLMIAFRFLVLDTIIPGFIFSVFVPFTIASIPLRTIEHCQERRQVVLMPDAAFFLVRIAVSCRDVSPTQFMCRSVDDPVPQTGDKLDGSFDPRSPPMNLCISSFEFWHPWYSESQGSRPGSQSVWFRSK